MKDLTILTILLYKTKYFSLWIHSFLSSLELVGGGVLFLKFGQRGGAGAGAGGHEKIAQK